MTPTVLHARSSRLVWRWCVAYTSIAPRDQRERRRAELIHHLYESQQAGQPQRAVLGAALAGAADDVSWSVRLGVLRVLRSFLTPLPYLIAAGILPVWAAFYWGNQNGAGAHVATGVSELTAVGCLAIAGSIHLLRRRP
jgi:hypothetical protein